jgi:hypothetical protein
VKSVRLLLYVLCLSVCLEFSAFAANSVEKAFPEYPNYFLPQEYWFRAPDNMTMPENVMKASRTRVEEALVSLSKRIVIPIYNAETKHVENVRIFDLVQLRLNHALAAHGITAQIDAMPAGGVVRTELGYLYQAVWDGMHANPPVAPEKTLERITRDTRNLPAQEIFGVGSDVDILGLRADGKPLVAEEARILEQVADETVNSLRKQYEIDDYDGLSRAVFPLGDAKDYVKQIDRATSQGGNAADFLAISLRKQALVEPKQVPKLADAIIAGTRVYISESLPMDQKDANLMRSLRTAMELPYTQLDAASLTAFEKHLASLTPPPTGQPFLSQKATEQLSKGLRNARLAGGNNLLHRMPPGSGEGKFLALLERNGVPFSKLVSSYPIPPADDVWTAGWGSSECRGFYGEIYRRRKVLPRNPRHRQRAWNSPRDDDQDRG